MKKCLLLSTQCLKLHQIQPRDSWENVFIKAKVNLSERKFKSESILTYVPKCTTPKKYPFY